MRITVRFWQIKTSSCGQPRIIYVSWWVFSKLCCFFLIVNVLTLLSSGRHSPYSTDVCSCSRLSIFVNSGLITVWSSLSPSLVRCIQGWAPERRQAVIFGEANGLFLTSADHNSAICCGESLLTARLSLEHRMDKWHPESYTQQLECRSWRWAAILPHSVSAAPPLLWPSFNFSIVLQSLTP